MKNPPGIKAIRVLDGLRIEIDWSTKETLSVDLRGLLRAPFGALCERSMFEQARNSDWGDGIDWPGGLSLGADTLYDLCREQAGLPTVTEFNDWMKRNGLSLATASEALGMTRRMIAHYRTGSRPIPRVVGLALIGFAQSRKESTQRRMRAVSRDLPFAVQHE